MTGLPEPDMFATMSTRKFLAYNLGFWLLAATVLLIDAWPNAQRHWDVAILRYIYFLLVVLLVTSALTLVYDSAWFRGQRNQLAWQVAYSILAALLTAIIVNPLTYLMAGANIHAVPYEILSTGTLYFALFYLVWSVLFFQLRRPEPAEASPAPPAERVFTVEKQGQRRQLQDKDICYIAASGDYVELVTAGNRYLQKEALARLSDQLDPARFLRIHRSTIINLDKVESAVPRAGGIFEFTLEGNLQVQSSRSYKAVIEGVLPQE